MLKHFLRVEKSNVLLTFFYKDNKFKSIMLFKFVLISSHNSEILSIFYLSQKILNSKNPLLL